MIDRELVIAAVVINLVVGAYDKAGRSDVGDRIDLRCRWLFPLVYAALPAWRGSYRGGSRRTPG